MPFRYCARAHACARLPYALPVTLVLRRCRNASTCRRCSRIFAAVRICVPTAHRRRISFTVPVTPATHLRARAPRFMRAAATRMRMRALHRRSHARRTLPAFLRAHTAYRRVYSMTLDWIRRARLYRAAVFCERYRIVPSCRVPRFVLDDSIHSRYACYRTYCLRRVAAGTVESCGRKDSIRFNL